jgi:hypothetical protein
MRTLVSLAAAAASAATASAQLVTGTITDANAVYEHASFATGIGSALGSTSFRGNGPTAPDQVYQTIWLWRLDADPREYVFHNGAAQGALSSVYTTNRVVHSWADVDLRGLAATRDVQVFSAGPGAGFAVDKMTVTNNTGAPILLNLFAYVDIDVCGTPAGDSAVANPNNNKISITDPGCTTVMEAFAPGADHYELGIYPALRARLVDALFDNLTDTGLPFGPADVTGAWQWQSRQVAPGASLTAYVVLALDRVHSGCVSVARASTYGAGKPGTNGVPLFDTTVLPLLGRTANLTVTSGLAGSAPFFILGAAAANIPFPPFGTILVDPNGAALFGGAPFDASHESRTPIGIPNSPFLCSTAVNVQAFIADPAATGSVSHTDGLIWLLGGVH